MITTAEKCLKKKIAWRRMAEQGQHNASCTVYGYRKSKEDKHKLEIEPEEARIVKEIFDMKIAGTGTTHIAKVLNDRDIPCPSEWYRSRGETRRWKGNGRKCYWIASMIERIIRNEVYTGTLVQLKTKTETVGCRQIKKPKEEWVRIENTHEAIVSYSQYIKSVSSLKQQKATERKIFITVDVVAGHYLMCIVEPSFADSGHIRLIQLARRLKYGNRMQIWQSWRQ